VKEVHAYQIKQKYRLVKKYELSKLTYFNNPTGQRGMSAISIKYPFNKACYYS
jgi:hypothetical protein